MEFYRILQDRNALSHCLKAIKFYSPCGAVETFYVQGPICRYSNDATSFNNVTFVLGLGVCFDCFGCHTCSVTVAIGRKKLIYRFENFELDCEHSSICRDGVPIKLEPQVYSVIELLVTRHGEIVSREELLEHVWQGRTVSNSAIDSRIRTARKALDDDGHAQRLIKTFTHRGFKFVGDVDESQPTAISASDILGPAIQTTEELASTTVIGKPPVDSASLGSPKRNRPIILIFVAVLAAVGLGFFANGRLENAPTDDSQSASTESRLSIAVLPASGDSADEDARLFATGVSEETIVLLGGIQELSVVSRSSSFAFRDRDFSAEELNEALNVDYRVESTSRTIGETIHVTVQLIDTSTESIEWSESYDVDAAPQATDAGQIEVARKIVLNIANKLGLSAGVLESKIISAEAYQDFAVGQEALLDPDEESINQAIESFRKVIAAEPDYLPAYARLFDSYWAGVNIAGFGVSETVPDMQRIVRQMTTLAPNSAETLTADGILMQFDEREDYTNEKVVDNFNRAIAANPNYVLAHKERAFRLAEAVGRDEALTAFQDALKYDPVAPDLLAELSWLHFSAGDFDDAIITAERNLRWNNDSIVAKIAMARILLGTDEQAKAIVLLQEVLAEQGENYAARHNLRRAYLYLGEFERAFEVSPSPTLKAVTSGLMGDEERVREFAGQMPGFSTSLVSLYFIGESRPFHDRVVQDIGNGNILDPEVPLYTYNLIRTAMEADVLRQFGNPLQKQATDLLDGYYAENKPADFRATAQYAGAVSYLTFKGELDEALKIIDQANERGFAFLHIFEMPMLDPLTRHQGFAARQARMRARATAILNEVEELS